MSDPKVVKRTLLHDLLQRARSSTHSAGGPKFLTTSNPSLRGSRSSLKSPSGLESPKLKTSRISSKKLHLPSVFRSRKETSPSPDRSKVEKANTAKRRHSFYEEDKKSVPSLKKSPFFKRKADIEKRQIKLAEKVLKDVVDKHAPKKENFKSPIKEPTPKHVLYTTYEENNLNTLLHNNETVTVIPWKTDKQIPVSPGRSLKKVSICTSCGHVGDKAVEQTITITPPSDEQKETEKLTSDEIKTKDKDSKNDKINSNPLDAKEIKPPPEALAKLLSEQKNKTAVPSKTETEKPSPKLLTKPPLFRSNSDPISPTQLDTSRRILQQQKQQIREAKITHTKSLRKPIRRRHTDTIFYSADEAKNNSEINEFCNGKIMMPKMRNSISDIYPMLKTKIPEEQVQNDGSVTYRKARTEADKNVDRDSGVDVDNKIQRANSKDSDCDVDNETSTSAESIPEIDNNTTDDTLKKSKHSVSPESEVQSSDNDTLTWKSKKAAEDEDNKKWDMYALLRRFECIEWDLFPAANLKRQTLDLDNCNLNCVPAAVTEIEYYAFRDVEAVSLNHNHNVTNADVLGKLADLRVINMWGCNLKTIPQTWSRLTKLQMLGLGNNEELTEFGPLKHLTNLTWLDLGGCKLKKIPDAVTNMMKLKVLALGCNPGIEIGDEICSLWDLKKLGLNDCALLEIPKPVFCLIKLTHLHLDNNFIRTIDQEIVQLKDLQELTVTGNDDIVFPKLLSQCDTIQSIVVDVGKDLSRMSGTLKNRIRHMPATMSPVKEYNQRRVSCT